MLFPYFLLSLGLKFAILFCYSTVFEIENAEKLFTLHPKIFSP